MQPCGEQPWVICPPRAWPDPPMIWSFTSLSDAESCPRRWALRNATYPDIWDGNGYPPRVSLAAMRGSIVHSTLEELIRAFHLAGSNGADATATEVLRSKGGYTNLLRGAIHREIKHHRTNPRTGPLLDHFAVKLHGSLPALRQHVQSALSRANLAASTTKTGIADQSRRAALGPGSHTEVRLSDATLCFTGIADLITIKNSEAFLVDFKTGAPKDSDIEQLQAYAVLWSSDQAVNPAGLPIASLRVCYPGSREIAAHPSEEQLETTRATLHTRILAVNKSIGLPSPEPRPSLKNCQYCDVRHLCGAYWTSPWQQYSVPGTGFADVEMQIISQHGPRSWDVSLERPATPALLRTRGFIKHERGLRIRMLGVSVSTDNESGMTILTETRYSETFRL